VSIIVVGAAVEALLLLWLAAADRRTFDAFVRTPDTSSYIDVAQRLAAEHTLADGPRTLGYPLFAAAVYSIGGEQHGAMLLIAIQLLLNLGLTWVGWRLLERLAPETALGVRVLGTLILFWAGLGLAAFLMTDFLAALSFAVFLYGVLFWRSRWGLGLATAALGLTTLTRPTFTFVPLLLPATAYLVARVTTRIPVLWIAALAAASVAATSVSVAYQYRADKYLGPSPLLILPIQEMIYYGTVEGKAPIDLLAFKKQFEDEVAARAGREFAALTRGEREEVAKDIFKEQFAAHPVEISATVLENGIKYVFAPIESIVMRVAWLYAGEPWYTTTLRPIVAAVCLPLFVLSLIPPVGGKPALKMYYVLMVGWLMYIIAFSAIGTGSGERIRFPLLAFMLPVCAWNLHKLLTHTAVAKLGRSARNIRGNALESPR
jgi:hypothetical protein